jgi:hypothetical protein
MGTISHCFTITLLKIEVRVNLLGSSSNFMYIVRLNDFQLFSFIAYCLISYLFLISCLYFFILPKYLYFLHLFAIKTHPL